MGYIYILQRTEVSVSISGHHLEHSIVDGEERDIEGSSSEVKDEDVLLSLPLVQTIRNGCCSPA